MVFPGTLSRGCSRCRKRKIKCDGRRPGCKRCELYKAPCPGYDRPLAFRFHGEPGHSLVREKPGRSTTSRMLTSGEGVTENEGRYEGTRGARAMSRTSGVTVLAPRQPQPSFEDESLAFFLHEYCVQPAPGVFRGHLDFLEDMYRGSDHASCIRPATLAVAYMSLSRHYKSSTLYVTARKYYGAALRSINRDLSASSKQTLREETLTSLMLLGIIEDLECQGQNMKAVHMNGIAQLFELVGQKVLANISTSLYGWIFVQLQVPSLTSKEGMDCLVIPDAQMDTSNPSMRLALVTTHCGQFYRAAKRITASDQPPLTPAEQRIMLVKVLQQGLAIGGELAVIEKDTMPLTLQPQQTTDKRPVTPGGQSLISFNSQWTACTWSFFSSCLIVFFTTLYKCSVLLLELSPADGPEKKLAQTTAAIADGALRKTAYMFCSALPYLFGEVDVRGLPLAVPQRQTVIMYHMVWPLSVLIASPHSTPHQVAICQMRLNMVRDVYGVKVAWYTPGLARDLLAL
ncbi:hypothetical protein BKA59DRAFT_487959 [Fusarium tricinctum]|uniref:Zn(2)-C6 fungal-type domain-containing protein n=1 Tax=Fusarium tricinctum TaxID=61284 RepID=A0A8K0RNH4_9HYPO|nr:hypothetical protein BKA59DRAFT_487959 [Fusarium tricinctum]